jgi:hypothetical protein
VPAPTFPMRWTADQGRSRRPTDAQSAASPSRRKRDAKWRAGSELLAVPNFHVVYTLLAAIRDIAYQTRR